MCGRYGVEQEYVQLALRYQAVVKAIDPGPRYNIAPTQQVPVIVAHEGERILTEHRWGLVPFWAKDLSVGAKMINARAETVATLPAFRESLAKRRCIIPATRFYEWQKVNKSTKIPHTILRTDGFPMSFAGLWASWRHPETNERVLSCSIITTSANTPMRALHDRMPVILEDDEIDAWLDQRITDPGELVPLLLPCPDDEVYAYPISRLVNDVKNDGPEVIATPPDIELLI
jgi:putative SOS response-associated peptidase YedK